VVAVSLAWLSEVHLSCGACGAQVALTEGDRMAG
jgi:hypothetical protein